VEETISSASNVDESTEISDGDDGTIVGLADFEVSELHGAFRANERALTTASAASATTATPTATTKFTSGSRSGIFSGGRGIFSEGFGTSDSEETVASKANYTALL
jgi:hypothetical protein